MYIKYKNCLDQLLTLLSSLELVSALNLLIDKRVYLRIRSVSSDIEVQIRTEVT